MKKLLLLSALVFILASCKKDQIPNDQPDDVFNDENWIRLRIPSGGELRGVAGSIDDTLVVTSNYDTYIITENGTKFTKTSRNLNYIPTLFTRRDTIFALVAQGYEPSTKRHFVSTPSYYSTDKGITWNFAIADYKIAPVTLGLVKTKNNTTYEINYRSGADKNGNGNNWVLRSTIKRIVNGNAMIFKHPIRNEQANNLYLDKNDRLYIPTGGSFSDSEVYIGASLAAPAYLYVSKQPVD